MTSTIGGYYGGESPGEKTTELNDIIDIPNCLILGGRGCYTSRWNLYVHISVSFNGAMIFVFFCGSNSVDLLRFMSPYLCGDATGGLVTIRSHKTCTNSAASLLD